jgi:G3E family GTPase
MRTDVLAHHRVKAIDAVVIETSGTADPEAIGKLMSDHGLAEAFQLRSIVTVVAPAKLSKLLGNLPVVEAQLQCSDTIVINKTDTVDAATLHAVEAAVRALNPTARIVRASYCEFEYSLPAKPPAPPEAELATCDANPFTTAEVVWPDKRSLAEAKAWLRSLPDSILRIKGRIETPEGSYHVERTVDGLEVGATAPGPARLVLIAHDEDEADLVAAVAAVASTANPCIAEQPGRF